MNDTVVIDITDEEITGSVTVFEYDGDNNETGDVIKTTTRINANLEFDVIGEVTNGYINLFDDDGDYEIDYSEYMGIEEDDE